MKRAFWYSVLLILFCSIRSTITGFSSSSYTDADLEERAELLASPVEFPIDMYGPLIPSSKNQRIELRCKHRVPAHLLYHVFNNHLYCPQCGTPIEHPAITKVQRLRGLLSDLLSVKETFTNETVHMCLGVMPLIRIRSQLNVIHLNIFSNLYKNWMNNSKAILRAANRNLDDIPLSALNSLTAIRQKGLSIIPLVTEALTHAKRALVFMQDHCEDEEFFEMNQLVSITNMLLDVVSDIFKMHQLHETVSHLHDTLVVSFYPFAFHWKGQILDVRTLTSERKVYLMWIEVVEELLKNNKRREPSCLSLGEYILLLDRFGVRESLVLRYYELLDAEEYALQFAEDGWWEKYKMLEKSYTKAILTYIRLKTKMKKAWTDCESRATDKQPMFVTYIYNKVYRSELRPIQEALSMLTLPSNLNPRRSLRTLFESNWDSVF